MTYSLTQEQIDLLRLYQDTKQFAAAYDYLAQITGEIENPTEDVNLVHIWLRGAGEINQGLGPFSKLVLTYNTLQAALRGVAFNATLNKQAADEIADKVLENAIRLEAIPTFEAIKSADAEGAKEIYKQLPNDTAFTNASAWSGNFLISPFGHDESGRLIASGQKGIMDTVDDLKNVIYASYAFPRAVIAAAAGGANFEYAFGSLLTAGTTGLMLPEVERLANNPWSKFYASNYNQGKVAGEALRFADTFTSLGLIDDLSRLFNLTELNSTTDSNLVERAKAVFSALNAELTVSSLANSKPAELINLAQSDIAYRYALKSLNPFSIEDADYSQHNQDGSLDLYDPVTGQGEMTEAYLYDRAKMLSLKHRLLMEGHDFDEDYINPGEFTFLAPEHYQDLTSGLELEVGNNARRSIIFGTDEGDQIYGLGYDDRLYGGRGSDVLRGLGGADYLEGGSANDTLQGDGDDEDPLRLNGTPGNDTLVGGTGFDTYIWEDGDGTDIIRDVDGRGRILINDHVLGSGEEQADGSFIHEDVTGFEHRYVVVEGDIYSSEGGTLLVNQAFRIENYRAGDLGLTALEPAAPTDPEVYKNPAEGFTEEDIDQGSEEIIKGDPFIVTESVASYDYGGIYSADISESYYDKYSIRNIEVATTTMRPLGNGEEEEVPSTYSYEYGVTKEKEDGSTETVYHSATARAKRRHPKYAPLLQDNWEILDQSVESEGTDANGDQAIYTYSVTYYEYDTETGNPTNGGSPEARQDDLRGTVNGDVMMGLFGIDRLYGKEGNDQLFGGDDVDRLFGGADNDTLVGGAGNDQLIDEEGSNQLSGGENDDTLITGGGDDSLSGDDGYDTLTGGDGQDWLSGGNQRDLLDAQAGDDYVYGHLALSIEDAQRDGLKDSGTGSWGDWMNGGSGNDTLIAHVDDDVLMGGGGRDILLGGSGQDYLWGDGDWFATNTDWVVELRSEVRAYLHTSEAGKAEAEDGDTDVIYGGSGDDIVIAGAGNDIVYGEVGDDTLVGNDHNDVMLGGDGRDQLFGDGNVYVDDPSVDAGDDYLDGGNDADELFGMSGHDTLLGGAGNDTLVGDKKEDEQPGNDFLEGEEGNDELWAYAGVDTLYGGNGEDTLSGGIGRDLLYGGSDKDKLQGGAGNDWLEGNGGDDEMLGGADNDTLDGGSGRDSLWGEAGSDTLIGNQGDDLLIGDVGDGSGEQGNDVLEGGYGEDTLYGEGGNDTLLGGADNDTLDGGEGSDSLIGGSGDNYLYTEDDHNVLIGGSGQDIMTAQGNNNELRAGNGENQLTLTGSHSKLHSGQEKDRLTANGNYNELYAGSGADWLLSSGLANTLHGEGGDDLLTAQGANSTLIGGSGHDILNGSAGNDVLDGGSGRDQLKGSVGNDDLLGGSGNDVYFYGSADGSDYFSDSSGDDDVLILSGVEISANQQTDSHYVLSLSNGQTLTFDKAAGDLGGIDRIVFDNQSMQFSAQQLVQMTSFDDMNSQGNHEASFLSASQQRSSNLSVFKEPIPDPRSYRDALYLQYVGHNIEGTWFFPSIRLTKHNDTVVIDGSHYPGVIAGDGDDLVFALDDQSDMLGGGGDDTLVSGDYSDHLIGGADGDTLFAQAGEDFLEGESGADHLYGGSGRDTLYGGDNSDLVFGGADDDVLYGYRWNQYKYISSDVNDGDDRLFGEGGNDDVYGNRGNDELSGGSGHDQLVGGHGDDILDGGEGSDNLQGGADNDRLLGGAANDNLHGGEGKDWLYGETGDDELHGGEGNDYLDGGAGDDWLVGGNGNDIYVFGRGYGYDTIDNSGTFFDFPSDTVELTLKRSEVIFSRGEGSDLWITVNGSSDRLTIKNYFTLDSFDYWQDGAIYTQLSYQNASPYEAVSSINFTDGQVSYQDVLHEVDQPVVGDVYLSMSAGVTQGQTVEVLHELSDQDNIANIRYQWLADQVEIAGENAKNYTLTEADVGKHVSVDVFVTDDNGRLSHLQSLDMTSPVLNTNDAPVVSTQAEPLIFPVIDDSEALLDITAVGNQGDFVLSWWQDSNFAMIQRFNRSGDQITPVSTPINLGRGMGNPPTISQDRNIEVASLNDEGKFVVVWSGEGVNNSSDLNDPVDVYVQQFNVDGTPLHKQPVRLRSPDIFSAFRSVEEMYPAINVFDDGSYQVRWKGSATYTSDPSVEEPDSDYYAQRFNPDGTLDGIPYPVSVEETSGATEVVSQTGDYVQIQEEVLWQADDQINFTNFVQKYHSDGSTGGFPLQSVTAQNVDTTAYYLTPDIAAVGNDGEFIVAYSDYERIYLQPFTADGYAATAGGATRAISPQQAQQDQAFSFIVPDNTFDDPDLPYGDYLTLSASLADGSNLPDWLSFNADTQRFSGVPAAADINDLSIKLTATDQFGLSAETEFDITFQNINDAPVLAETLPVFQAAAGVDWQAEVGPTIFTDADLPYGDSLTLSARLLDGGTLPDWLTFDAANGLLSGTIPDMPASQYDILIRATDQHGLSAATTLTLQTTMEDITISGQPEQNQTVTARVPFTDADWSFQWLADGVNIADATERTLNLGQDEVGKSIQVMASYANELGKVTRISSQLDGLVSNVNDAPAGNVWVRGEGTTGQTLTAFHSLEDLDGMPDQVSYQWQADGMDIDGATGVQYTPGPGEVGQPLSVVVSYVDDYGTFEQISSQPTTVIDGNHAPEGELSVQGEAKQYQTLIVNTYSLADVDGLPETLNYQWQANGVDIEGATEQSLTLTQNEVDQTITVTVSYTDNDGYQESVSSTPTQPVENVNDEPEGMVTIDGEAILGQTLSASHTLTDRDGMTHAEIQYQWQADGVDIAGATGNSYTITTDNIGQSINVTATYTDDYNTTESVSGTATAVVIGNRAPDGAVVIEGEARQGQTLVASDTITDADGRPDTLSYQWQANGVDIAGATSPGYTLTQAEVDQPIRVIVRYTDGLGHQEQLTSGSTEPVININDAPEGQVHITGELTEDQTLSAAHTLSDLDGMPDSVTYDWSANGQWLQSGAQLSLTAAHIGQQLQLTARYTDGYGTAESVTSELSAPVSYHNDAPIWVGAAGSGGEEYATVKLEALGNTTGWDWRQQISAVGDQGEYVVAWSGTDADSVTDPTYWGDDSVFVQQFNADGSTTGFATVQLEAPGNTQGYDTSPQMIALSNSSDYLIVFEGDQAAESGWGDSSLFIQRFSADGLPQGEMMMLEAFDNTAGMDLFPQATEVGNGNLVITWQGADDGMDDSVYVQLLDAQLNPMADMTKLEGLIDYGNDQRPQVAALGTQGAYAIAWSGNDAEGDSSIFVQRFNPDGSKASTWEEQLEWPLGEPEPLQPNSFETKPQLISLDESGRHALVWEGERPDGSGLSAVWLQTYTADGNPAAPRQMLQAPNELGGDSRPQLTALTPMGDFAVSWTSADQAAVNVYSQPEPSGPQSYYVQTFNASGTAHSTPQRLPVDGVSQEQWMNNSPQLTALGNQGRFVAAWSAPDAEGDNSIHIQRLDISGQPDGQRIVLEASDNTTGDDYIPKITALGDQGAFAVTWEGEDRDGDTSTYVQQFDANGHPLLRNTQSSTDASLDHATQNQPYTFSVPGDWFHDADSLYGDTLNYQLSQPDGQPLPEGFTFDPATMQLSGLPGQSAVGNHALILTATDTQGLSAHHELSLTVANVNDAPEGEVLIHGDARQYQTLSVSHTLSDLDGMPDPVSYQWYANGQAISGATGTELTLDQQHVDQTIHVTASYTDGFGQDEHVSSATTAAVENVNDAPQGDVLINGEARQYQTLSVSHTLSDLDGMPNPVSYQWYANGQAITGATGTELTLAQAHVDQTIHVTVHYTDGYGQAEQVSSATTAAVANVNDAPQGEISLHGDARQHQTLRLTHNLSDLDGMPTPFTIQWLADGEAIRGATADHYTLTQADVGKPISAAVSYTDGYGFNERVTSGETVPIVNVNDAPEGEVRIHGDARQYQTLSVSHTLSDLDGMPNPVSYQWYANGQAISGATGTELTLDQQHVDQNISVSARYTDGFGAAEQVSSAATAAVDNVNDAPEGKVQVQGAIVEQYRTFTIENTLTDLDGLGELHYQWLADGQAIAGATQQSYTLSQSEVGKRISAAVSYTDGYGFNERVTSGETVPVVNVNDAPEGEVLIHGDARQYQTLSVSHTLSDLDGMPNPVSYQWYANGQAISGATGTELTLDQQHVDQNISVSARYTDGFGVAEQVSSAATAAVDNVNDAPVGHVNIHGDIRQGQTLHASHTLSDLDGMPDPVSYQWYANGQAISSATGATYQLQAADVGRHLEVTARYIDGYGAHEAVTSAPTADIIGVQWGTPGADQLTGTPYRDELYGLAGNDHLTGRDSDDRLDGGTGADTLIGGAGQDHYIVDQRGDIVREQSRLAGEIDQVSSSISYRLGANLEQLTLTGTADLNGTGNALNNTITGNRGNNWLNGAGGIDTLMGGQGDDRYRVDHSQDQIIENADQGTDRVYSTASYTLSDNLEHLTLRGRADLSGTGNAQDNILRGNRGNNRLLGREGQDYFIGGRGHDTLIGGAGDDHYIVQQQGDQVIEQANQGHDVVRSRVDYTLGAHIETLALMGGRHLSGTGNAQDNRLLGNRGDNQLTGHAGNDTLAGGRGADTLIGGAGDDTYEIDHRHDQIIEQRNQGNDHVNSRVSHALSDYIETLTLTGTRRIDGMGNALDNIITGNDRDNQLDGGAGADWLIGKNGNDHYWIDHQDDRITEQQNQGTDQVSSQISYTLGEHLEHLTLTGRDNLSGRGNERDNRLTGNNGDNTLNGRAGNDTLIGGRGNDHYILDTLEPGDRIIERRNQGIDHVTSLNDYQLGANLEHLTLGDYAMIGIGNREHNHIIGNELQNLLHGKWGNDTLDGGHGDDTLNGGQGTDQLIGGQGDDSYHTDGRDQLIEQADQGFDSVQYTGRRRYQLQEHFEGLLGNGTLNGNDADNLIQGQRRRDNLNGQAGDDILQGQQGHDRLQDTQGNNLLDGGQGRDTVNGGAGHDHLIGGRGNDVLVTGTGYDIISYNQGDGSDQIYGSGSTTLSLSGIDTADLSLKRRRQDLVLNVGERQRLTFKNWYQQSDYQHLDTLQLIHPTADTPLNIQQYDFSAVVADFEASQRQTGGKGKNKHKSRTAWQVMNSLLDHHLQSSDDAAIGGDVAAHYAQHGHFTGISPQSAQQVMKAPEFGQANQQLEGLKPGMTAWMA